MHGKSVIFVSGLGTPREYFEPLMSLIPFQSYFFLLDVSNTNELSQLIHYVLSLEVTELYVVPFSISCYITSHIVQTQFAYYEHKINLVLLDPPDAKNNSLANIVLSAPEYILWAWDYVLSCDTRCFILAALGGFTTPKIVDVTLAKMSIRRIKAMIIEYLVHFIPPRGFATSILRGSKSKYQAKEFDTAETYILPTDHHMVWHRPDLVADFIIYGTIPSQQ